MEQTLEKQMEYQEQHHQYLLSELEAGAQLPLS